MKELTEEQKKLSVTWVYPEGNITFPIVLEEISDNEKEETKKGA